MSVDQTILTVVGTHEPCNLLTLVREVRAASEPRFVGLAYIGDRVRELTRKGYIARDGQPGGTLGHFYLTEAGLEAVTA